MALERGNYTDIMERGEYSIDPRDLVRHTPPVEFGTVGIVDREAFNRLMGEPGMLQKMGAQDTSIGFIVKSASDEAYELLDPEDRLRVENGQHIVIENSGNTRVLQSEDGSQEIALVEGVEALVEPRVVLPAGSFGWIREDVEVPFIPIEVDGRTFRLIDLSGTDPRLSSLGSKLNGSSSKAKSLAVKSVRVGLSEGGIIPGARIIVHPHDGSPVFAVQSGGSDDSKRVSAALSLPAKGSNDAYLWATFMYGNFAKAANRIGQIH